MTMSFDFAGVVVSVVGLGLITTSVVVSSAKPIAGIIANATSKASTNANTLLFLISLLLFVF